jgi:site-specific DNA-methyltransferase (adenine-specific)
MNILTKNYKLYLGDCLEIMKNIADKSIDMILCDLPYGATKNKWDSIIPFDEIWKQYNRIIKDNGAIVLFAQGMFTSDLMQSNKKYWRYNLIWEKDRPSGFLNAKRMPLRSHEDICVFYKKIPTYNPQMWEGKPSHSIGKVKGEKKCNNNNNYGDFSRVEREGNLKYPRSILKFDRPHPPVHPTQKSVECCEWLIKTYTNENEIVLDNCMGSGTTGVACVQNNRSFIGIEIDENYFNIAEQRIRGVLNESNR